MSEFDEDELIDEIRRKDEQIRELEAELKSLRPGQTATNKLDDILIDPNDVTPEYLIRVEPRSGGTGVFFYFKNRKTTVVFMMGMDIQTGENIAYTILKIAEEERERKLAELNSRSINDDF